MSLAINLPENFDPGLVLSGGAFAVAVLCFIASFVRRRKYSKLRKQVESLQEQIESLENTMARNKELFDTNAERMAEQARRVNWLETRVRQPKLPVEEVIDDTHAAEPQKINITERRHRVMKLASRGQNVEMIAASLGMLPGEVELIVNLNRAAAVAGR